MVGGGEWRTWQIGDSEFVKQSSCRRKWMRRVQYNAPPRAVGYMLIRSGRLIGEELREAWPPR